MGIIIRQSLKSTIISYAGVVLGALNTLLLFPRLLQPDEFGLTRVLLSVAMMVAQFAEFGGGNVINRYFPLFRNEKDTLRRFLFWVIVLALTVYAIIAMGIYFFREPILGGYNEKPLVVQFYWYIFPMAAFILLFNLLESYSRSLLRIVVPNLLREFFLRIATTLIIVLYHFGIIDFNWFIFLFAASFAIAAVVIAAYVFWLDGQFISASLAFAGHEKAKEVFVYGLFSIMTTAVWRAVSQLDVIMLSYLNTLGGVAVYTIAFYIVTLIQLPQRFLLQISVPIISGAIQHERWDEVKQLYQRAALNQFIIGMFIFLGIWVNLDSLYHFLPETYHGMGGVILVLTIGRLIDMATGFNTEIIAYSKHFRFNLIIGIVLIVSCVVTNYLLIPPYGILGAAIGTSVSLTLFNIAKTVYVYQKFNALPFGKNMAVAFFIAVGIAGIAYLVPSPENVYLSLLVKTALALLFLPLLFILRLSDDMNNLFLNMLGRIRAFLKI